MGTSGRTLAVGFITFQRRKVAAPAASPYQTLFVELFF
jgi:hypothetical protein